MNTTLRILDANANRALEAARMLEDLARFALTEPGEASELSREGKAIRHELRDWLDGVDPRADRVTRARDTPGDPGTGHATAGEQDRAGMRGVALAAGSRLAEALRVLEECAKLLPAPGAGSQSSRPEALRYRGYTLTQRVVRALAPPCPQWALCVLITESLCAHHRWETVADRAIAGGAGCLQLREKGLTDRELLDRARRLVAIAAGRAHVIVNDRPDICVLSGADGVHLGQADMSVSDARAVVGSRWIGVSTADLGQARRAFDDGADTVGLGPMFPSATKPKDALSGPVYLRAFLADPVVSEVPHLAISGIDAGRAGELASMGCRGVAVSGAVCGSDNPEAASRAIRAAIDNAPV